MKREIIFTLIAAFVILFAGCTKDNFDPPTSILTGTITYNSSPVGVRSNGTQLELWQYGFKLRSKIAVYIAQDGTYSARLFDGNYKLVRLGGAPWVNQTDSINVTVSGATKVDVPVVPYFIITGETFSYAGGVLSASCTVTKVGTVNIERLTLYVGATSIVDASNNGGKSDKTGSALSNLTVPLTYSYTVPTTLTSKSYIYVRIGVKTTGVGELLYTPVKKIQLN
ncbi:MAG: DUF3823 domain-containing protein [Bacteroidota bacterium]|jgi:Protein of unknown function (DUF3823) N-terminal domain/Domain of unknown function (DUF3823_C)